MKCVSCGAILEADQIYCPYCGALNEAAAKRKSELDNMEKENRELKKEILEKSKEEVIYKIHKRVNIALVCIFILSVVISFGVFLVVEEKAWRPKGTEEEMICYYEEKDYENLYLCMSSGELFDSEKYYDYSHIALLWNAYMDCQAYFGQAYQAYVETGVYDAYYLEQCIGYGCDVLSGNLSGTYSELSEENKKRFAPYQEQVKILFTGVLQIPEELINTIYNAEVYNRAEPLVEYVLEVLPNE